MKNKKAIGTASTFLITSLVVISILTVIGVAVSRLGNDYNVNTVSYFDNYDGVYRNITGVAEDYVGDYDITLNETNTDRERFEDNLFLKAFKIITNLPSLLSGIGVGLGQIQEDLGIPGQFMILIYSLLGIVLISSLVMIIRGFRDV